MTPKRRVKIHEFAADREIWERQPWHTDKTWAQFLMYRDLGVGRTLTQAAELLTISHGHARNVASQFRWREMAQSFDGETARLRAAEIAVEWAKALKAEAAFASNSLRRLSERLKRVTDTELNGMSVMDVMRSADLTFKWFQHALGTVAAAAPAQTAQADNHPTDYTMLSEDEQKTRLVELREEIDRQLAALSG